MTDLRVAGVSSTVWENPNQGIPANTTESKTIIQRTDRVDVKIIPTADGAEDIEIFDKVNEVTHSLKGVRRGDVLLVPIMTKDKRTCSFDWWTCVAINYSGPGRPHEKEHGSTYEGGGYTLDVWPRNGSQPIWSLSLAEYFSFYLNNGMQPYQVSFFRLTNDRKVIEKAMNYYYEEMELQEKCSTALYQNSDEEWEKYIISTPSNQVAKRYNYTINSKPVPLTTQSGRPVTTKNGKPVLTNFNCIQGVALAWSIGGGLPIPIDDSWKGGLGFWFTGTKNEFRWSGYSIYKYSTEHNYPLMAWQRRNGRDESWAKNMSEKPLDLAGARDDIFYNNALRTRPEGAIKVSNGIIDIDGIAYKCYLGGAGIKLNGVTGYEGICVDIGGGDGNLGTVRIDIETNDGKLYSYACPPNKGGSRSIRFDEFQEMTEQDKKKDWLPTGRALPKNAGIERISFIVLSNKDVARVNLKIKRVSLLYCKGISGDRISPLNSGDFMYAKQPITQKIS